MTAHTATVAQSIRMIEAGCELVRITAPSKKDAENLAAQIAVEYFQRAIQAETGGGSADSPCEDSNQI